MKKYHLDITISNDHGELLDTRRSFDSIDEVNMFMTDATKMHELWSQAEKYGHEEGLLLEELYGGKDEYEKSVGGVDFTETFDALDKLTIIK